MMLKKVKTLLLVSRPISWLNTAYPFAAGYLASGGTLNATFFIGTIYFLIPYNLLMYGVNDVFDYESDIRNPRKGGIEGAREQKSLHPTIIWSATLANIPFLLWMLLTGNFISAIVLLTLLFFVVAYSAAKLRFKEIPVLDSVTSSAHFVGPLIYALTLTSFSITQLPFVIAFFLWGVASHAFGAVQDIIPDREAKLKSIATFFGAKATVITALCLYIVSSFIVIYTGLPNSIIGLFGLLYALNILPYVNINDENSAATNNAWRRFIWLNLITGFVITLVLIIRALF